MNTQQRTIVRLWRDAVASGRPDPLYLAEGDGDWTPVPLAEAARRVDELAAGLAERFSIDQTRALDDVVAFAREMARRQLLAAS